jgi:2-polyprenyl-3-methyl-5-hydroxy-6-metoxy-1,4-benzoquinol methylase
MVTIGNVFTEEVDKCPVCGGDGSFYRVGYDEQCKELPIQLYRCHVCESFYQNPRMTAEASFDYYQSGLYRSVNRTTYDNELVRATRIGNYAKTLIGGKVTRCLDYGCSRGSLVDVLSTYFNAEVIGYDIYVDPETKIPVVDDKSEIDGAFDLITCTHTLEHLGNPFQELEWMKSMLVEGGVLMFEVPLAEEIKIPHPIIFSRKSMPLLMERVGFADYVISCVDQNTKYIKNNVLDNFMESGFTCVVARKNGA